MLSAALELRASGWCAVCALGKAIEGVAELQAVGYKWPGISGHDCRVRQRFMMMCQDDEGLLDDEGNEFF